MLKAVSGQKDLVRNVDLSIRSPSADQANTDAPGGEERIVRKYNSIVLQLITFRFLSIQFAVTILQN